MGINFPFVCFVGQTIYFKETRITINRLIVLERTTPHLTLIYKVIVIPRGQFFFAASLYQASRATFQS